MREDISFDDYKLFKGTLEAMQKCFECGNYGGVMVLFNDILRRLDTDTIKLSDKFMKVYTSMCSVCMEAKLEIEKKNKKINKR